MAVKMKNALSSALASTSGQKLGDVVFVGSGGPFDVVEGTSSIMIRLGRGKGAPNILVDCGPTVYSSLRKNSIGNDVEAIIVTSATEASLGSLSTLICHLYIERAISTTQELAPIKVVCGESLASTIQSYLFDVSGLSGEMASVSSNLDMQGSEIKFLPALGRVCPFILKFGPDNSRISLIHSGNSMMGSAFDEMAKYDPYLLRELRDKASDVIVFHNATLSEEIGCPYTALSKWSEEFRNFFVFGHSKEDGTKIIFSERYMRSLSTNDGNNEFTIEKQLGI